ncbi:MAG: hypothetical protein A3I11_02125 [Elusimicrobia bacterium RIFCSPLOWO2_02_FULL_39_32]|nr:MAG: hypothetical protein A2034_01135 [Elusimicrobia bacterium GWA2_38_7]OGR78416.1 MAG: hypothetical protein A3B80_07010 [Elusimicrobia bacterium RIFCSPHIGHO2_02_FULL_39_36]OGR92175.1 MAG: hypothetical protein A3I11_02125 [Elusimicrobia bacterium RIFCSPLOWO2_02_FULL_39_32]OGR99957.1 MAG: hypothetical protein A3G85_03310 [Elusimicrobia bacterium RIFCSPLOWO2_12_FULL_39_28]
MNPKFKNCIVTLIRGPLVAPLGSLNNEPTPALGLAFLAGTLKEAGFDVRGIDATAENINQIKPIANTKLQYNGLGIEEIIDKICPSTKVIAISAMFSHEWTFIKKLITSIKNAFPNIPIIAGGEHSTALSEYSLRDCPSLDYIGIGEGEEIILEFCTKIATDQTISDVNGLIYLKNGDLVKNPLKNRIKDIDNIPWPDWEIIPIKPYLNNSISFGASFGRNMPIMASRGCPYQCTFCSNPTMWTTRYNIRSPDKVIEEIKYYKEKYDITGLQFYDLTAIIKKEWTMEFCQKLLDEKINLEWSLPSGTRSEALDDESLAMLAKTNCRYLVYAPESGSPETLKLIKKKISLTKMKASIHSAINNGIIVRTNLIIGFPHETRKNIWQTLKTQFQFALMGVDEAPLYPFQPYPGTELFDYLLNKGKLKVNDSYFEILSTLSTGKFSMPDDSFCENVGKRELHFYRILGFFSFYFLSYVLFPKRILRTILNLFFTNKSSTVFEQRLKDKLRRFKPIF